MLNIIKHKKWYFLFSLLVIIPGLISLLFFGLKLSIDFTGGSRIGLSFAKNVDKSKVNALKDVFSKNKIEVYAIQQSKNQLFVRTSAIPEKKTSLVLSELKKSLGTFKQEEFETVGPTIGREITFNALKALLLSSFLIVLYIAWSFRSVPKPASSWRFGICAIVALVHDVLVLVGLFSLLGHFFKVEVDSLFITAVLTVIGFSVHDTIVVFDRVRENLMRSGSVNFAQVVNDSILQTLTRSLNTSLTALLVLLTLLIFGGTTIHWFIVALFIGILSGTYSSIFNAAPLLVAWQEWDLKRKTKSA